MADAFTQVVWVLAILMAVVFFGLVVAELAGPVVRMIRRWVVYARLPVRCGRAG